MNLENWKGKVNLAFKNVGGDIKNILGRIFTIEDYSTIANLLGGQGVQVKQKIYYVKDISGDPTITFDDDELRKYGYYRYNGTPTGKISDYTLISAPHRRMGTTFTTDESLYLDPDTNILRSNLSFTTEVFRYESGAQVFTLTNTPTNIISVERNGVGMNDDLNQWVINVGGKKLTIKESLKKGNSVAIKYYYIIPPQ